MTHIIFYEKPGCGGNARQKAILQAAGHKVEAKNLLAEPWTCQRLLDFLAPLPVPHWFNRAAPEVKSGEIVPEEIDAATALSLFVSHPIFIRRPLMQAMDGEMSGSHHVGFVLEDVDAWVGLGDAWPKDAPRPLSAEGCVHPEGDRCPLPA
jgi:nitrogenase-associated protein